jgi:glycosyltransferase involved in cell wall biosynthesis
LIILSHRNGIKLIEIIRDDKILKGFSKLLVTAFWEVCEKYPEELIFWKEEGLEINTATIDEVFPHFRIMASYPVTDYFIPDTVGYVDQLPFVNPNRRVKYPTWRMSTDIGGIFGKVALKFRNHYIGTTSFGYIINSIAKIGQQNSLFCYSDPRLLKEKSNQISSELPNNRGLFVFVAQHYKKIRLLVLLLCFVKYERKFPLIYFISCLFKKSFFQAKVDLPDLNKNLENKISSQSIDVIIPTLGRPEHLKNVLIDLKNQKLIPTRVIIVEQNPDVNSETELNYLASLSWPFQIIHEFTHQTGACNARNMALNHVISDWVFFADDDIRLENFVIEDAINELDRFKVFALNMNCIQTGENLVFPKIKQWGAFGSGTSIVRSYFARSTSFSKEFENGFGEDTDYGFKLRNKGCDIIYHPDIFIKHLKASRGGFRTVIKLEENKRDSQMPKPSPTMMLLVKKHFNVQMQKGYKMNLFLKFYKKNPIKNPFVYYRTMQRRWKISEKMSQTIKESV